MPHSLNKTVQTFTCTGLEDLSQLIDFTSINLDFSAEKLRKVFFTLKVKYTRSTEHSEESTLVYHSSPPTRISRDSNREELMDQSKAFLEVAIERFQGRGSGWILESLQQLDLHIGDLAPISGAGSYLPLPDWVKNKRVSTSFCL